MHVLEYSYLRKTPSQASNHVTYTLYDMRPPSVNSAPFETPLQTPSVQQGYYNWTTSMQNSARKLHFQFPSPDHALNQVK